nr:DOF zinc finger protein DOF1.7-like [Tanacetum cinerariifolium]
MKVEHEHEHVHVHEHGHEEVFNSFESLLMGVGPMGGFGNLLMDGLGGGDVASEEVLIRNPNVGENGGGDEMNGWPELSIFTPGKLQNKNFDPRHKTGLNMLLDIVILDYDALCPIQAKSCLGPEPPEELRRGWYVKGQIRSGVISLVLAQRNPKRADRTSFTNSNNPSPSPAFVKENIDMLRTMVKEHDHHTKTKATPRKLVYVASKREALDGSIARNFSDDSPLSPLAHLTHVAKPILPTKVRRVSPKAKNRHTPLGQGGWKTRV